MDPEMGMDPENGFDPQQLMNSLEQQLGNFGDFDETEDKGMGK